MAKHRICIAQLCVQCLDEVELLAPPGSRSRYFIVQHYNRMIR